ncbi:cold-shock protein [Candidatus Woesearchaeota archaeon]|nr:cold-shock protein [Candidatus Woesearchaeota archaeon]
MEGTVKWYNLKKGYGFIKGEDEQDYFVHFSALNGAMLRENDKVSFDAVDTDRGKQAQQVKLLEKGSERGGSKRKQKRFGEEDNSEEFGSEGQEGYASEEQDDY